MFIIENYFDTRRHKIEAWESDKEKWLSGGNEYNYRHSDTWNCDHPYPVIRWNKVAKTIILILIFKIVLICGIMWIYQENQKPDPPKQPEQSVVYKNGDECGKHRVGDIGYINYGDYEGAEVKIIGGCKNSQPYEVQVTKDQTLFGEGSSNAKYNDKNIKSGLVFKVDSSDNLMITGHEEKKE